MPARTESDAQDAIAAAVELLVVLQGQMSAVLTEVTALEGEYGGDRIPAVSGGVGQMRGGLSASLAAGRQILDPLWLDYGQALGLPETAVQDVIQRIYRHMHSGTDSVKTRGITFGSPTADGGNTGNGSLLRLTTDEFAYPIEIGEPETFEAACVAVDRAGAEVFEVRGNYASPDRLEVLGSGVVTRLTSQSGDRSLLQNASFAQGVAATILPGWTVAAGSISTVDFDSTNYYRPAGPNDATPRSLRTTASLTLTQSLAGVSIDIARPYVLQLAWNRQVGGAEGTLTLEIGGVTKAVTVSAQTGWQILRIDLDADSWPRSWANRTVEIDWARTAGNILIDEVILTPMTRIRGQWYALMSGATDWALDDEFTWADTISSDSKIQAILQRYYGLYLPSDGTPTWADPT